MQNLTFAAHFCYGAATGALFGLIAPRRAAAGLGAGVLFGFGVGSASYLGWLPAAGLRQHPRHDMPARTRLMIGGHLLWGAAVGLMSALGRRRRAQASTWDRARA